MARGGDLKSEPPVDFFTLTFSTDPCSWGCSKNTFISCYYFHHCFHGYERKKMGFEKEVEMAFTLMYIMAFVLTSKQISEKLIPHTGDKASLNQCA